MMTLESYLTVAHLWYAEQQAGFNPYDGSAEEFLRLQSSINDNYQNAETEADGSVVAEDGWIDYAQDNVNTVEIIEEADKERHGDKFNKEEYEKSLMPKVEEAGEVSPRKHGYKFLVPKQIQHVGQKIKNLFVRHTRSNTVPDPNAQVERAQSPSPRKTNRDFHHYEDHDYQKQLSNEVNQLQ